MGIEISAQASSYVSGLKREAARIGVINSMDTVLIVEDSRPMQRTLQRLFEADSLQVQIACDGPSGLEAFRKERTCAASLRASLLRYRSWC